MGKVTTHVAQIMAGRRDRILLGNLDSKRDWGHAKDYVRMMWMMLQQEKPDDFVVATNKQYSVRDLCTLCFEMVGRPIVWRGTGLEEEGIDTATGQVLVQVSPQYFRPTEVETLLGDPAKAKKILGWVPEISFKVLVHEMLKYDMQQAGLELPAIALKIKDRKDQYC